jgi:hypothetical protein
MGRQAKAEVPRWQRKKQPPGPVVMVKGRKARKLTRDLRASLPSQPAQPQRSALAASQAFRFRFHLVPFWWLLGTAGAGLGLHQLHMGLAAILAGILAAAVIALLTRHLSNFARHASWAMAGLTGLWLPFLAFSGLTPPWPAFLLGCWLALVVPWVRHYRWRKEAVPPVPDATDAEIWERLAAKRKWSGHLGTPQPIAGGVQYPVLLNGAETHIGEVMAHPRAIAAAWGKPITEAYVEPDPTGIESLGLLTKLTLGTLDRTREWDGAGADPLTGIAVIARFPDELDARIRFWVPRDGTRHGLVAGATGSGKTYALDLLLRVAVACGLVVPVVLDPQEGQSLPQWRGHVRYASGVDECMTMLAGIRAGMFGRSRDLARRTWTDEDGHRVQGMDFYDPLITGLPIVLVIADEFPMLLTSAGKPDAKRAELAISIAGDIAKLGRKTGVALWPVAQVPSLDELGSRVLRSMLVGGNVVCLRTGERADAGMAGLAADPSTLPRYFRDGSPTAGLGYVVGPDNRQAPARIDMVSRRVRRVIPQVPELDLAFAAALDARGSVKAAPSPAFSPALSAVPPVEDQPGRSAADAVLAVLDTEMDRGDVIDRVTALCREEWGREPFSLRAVSGALSTLADAGRIARPSHGRYAPVRASLHVLPGTRDTTAPPN